jgi:putative endonuclease
MTQETRDTGVLGETIAADHLRKLGYDIIETNYRFARGEIDIIARDGEDLVFCEVKTRESLQTGPPEFAVTPAKQQQIRHVAAGYLYERGFDEMACRFDVVAIVFEGADVHLEHYRDAF